MKKRFFSSGVKLLIVLLLLLSYLIYNFFSGKRNILSLFEIDKNQTALEKEIDDLKAQKELFNKKITVMQPQSLDKDLLEEKARRDLGKIKQGETVYYYE
jgi:cell division protein FtsB